MAERFKAHAWKACIYCIKGSNPFLSASGLIAQLVRALDS